MEEIGILIVSYGARAAAMVKAFSDSTEYDVKLYIADKQKNPYNIKMAQETGGKHRKTGLDVENIVKFAKKIKDELDFCIVGPEDPIINSVRERVEEETNTPVIAPTSEYALEASKVRQRKILSEVAPASNPEYKVFDPEDYANKEEAIGELQKWLSEFGKQVAVKPDTPTAGKGVGVWGDHFSSEEELIKDWFIPNLKDGKVIVEEKVEGEEFSVQFISDGHHLIPTPPVRDYKRAFDRDLGPNTGGMGSYTYQKTKLPFMDKNDWKKGKEIAKKVFEKLREEGASKELRGIPLYMAYITDGDQVKTLEINSRFGDPEGINTLIQMKDDFVDVCLKIIKGNLTEINFKDLKTVLTYAVPMTYGGAREQYSGDKKVDLSKCYDLKKRYKNKLRIYEANLEKLDEEIKAGTSRSIAMVGVADQIEKAREISLKSIKKIDAPLWNRWDVASKEHIKESENNIGR
ncbi:MAG: Phosphoribosylamine-glycine ligase PurD [Candidatus Methanohalarchaeum thermophilum]|uniref:Phosphoribosylamine-glycine ligase PurD n=1 Tax=Methanohalarchaeum thermophilum TaxID=1903181 RepID=A0A1Q6DS21_METT1|nr:MAG: Phosphoribosylamine-glycine ligase PurD [Candidatus Methanohalarchaeum thermophilum]